MSSLVHTLFHAKCTFFIEPVRGEIMLILCCYVLTRSDTRDCLVLGFRDKQGASIQKPRKWHQRKIDILCQLGAKIVGWEVGSWADLGQQGWFISLGPTLVNSPQ